MTWVAGLNDVNVVLWGWLSWHFGGNARRHRRERLKLKAMERERWSRLAAGGKPSPAGGPDADADADADLGTRIAREYLRGVTILDRAESEAATAYIVADVSGRWPPSLDDLLHIAEAIGEPGSVDYLRSVVPAGCAEPPARTRSRWWRWRPGPRDRPAATPAPVTDDTAMAVTIRLMFTFCPPELSRGEYLARASYFSEEVRDLSADRILPALLLRRGPNSRVTAESVS